MMTGVLGIFATLVPQRYRPRVLGDANVSIRRSAMVSGIVQMVVCSGVLWARYPAFIRHRMQEAADTVIRAGGDRTAVAVSDFSIGVLGAVEYLIQPLTLMIFYFALEGTLRLVAPVATNEVVPTLPLQIVAWIHPVLSTRWQERAMGPRVADIVQAGSGSDYCLRIESCRPKDWTPLSTINYEERFYELMRKEDGPPPRRFVYLLRKMPPGKVIRGLHRYHPDEILQED